jgi:hypothetical protein
MPDRAKANSAIMRCRTRLVPLRTVNESLNGDAMREQRNGDAMREQRLFHLTPMHRIALDDISASALRLVSRNWTVGAVSSGERDVCL